MEWIVNVFVLYIHISVFFTNSVICIALLECNAFLFHALASFWVVFFKALFFANYLKIALRCFGLDIIVLPVQSSIVSMHCILYMLEYCTCSHFKFLKFYKFTHVALSALVTHIFFLEDSQSVVPYLFLHSLRVFVNDGMYGHFSFSRYLFDRSS